MPITLVGGASTQSRSRRPLPPGAISAQTLEVVGVQERTRFYYSDHTEEKWLTSWTVGQSGLIWGGGPFPDPIDEAIWRYAQDVHGSYGHYHEHALAEALGAALDAVLGLAD